MRIGFVVMIKPNHVQIGLLIDLIIYNLTNPVSFFKYRYKCYLMLTELLNRKKIFESQHFYQYFVIYISIG